MRAQGATNRRGGPRYPALMPTSSRALVAGPVRAPGLRGVALTSCEPRR
jgi:hypothetical protein